MGNIQTELVKKYKLIAETDYFIAEADGKKVIIKQGYLKIKRIINATVDHEIIRLSPDHQFCVVKSTGEACIDNIMHKAVDFGEAAPRNNSYIYPIAVAKKRGEARVIVELAGLSEEGWITEDELSTGFPDAKDNIIKPSDKSIDNTLKSIADKKEKKGSRVKKIKTETIFPGSDHAGENMTEKEEKPEKTKTVMSGTETIPLKEEIISDSKTPQVEQLAATDVKVEDEKKKLDAKIADIKEKKETISETSHPEFESIMYDNVKYVLKGEDRDGNFVILLKGEGKPNNLEVYLDENTYEKRIDILRNKAKKEVASKEEELGVEKAKPEPAIKKDISEEEKILKTGEKTEEEELATKKDPLPIPIKIGDIQPLSKLREGVIRL